MSILSRNLIAVSLLIASTCVAAYGGLFYYNATQDLELAEHIFLSTQEDIRKQCHQAKCLQTAKLTQARIDQSMDDVEFTKHLHHLAQGYTIESIDFKITPVKEEQSLPNDTQTYQVFLGFKASYDHPIYAYIETIIHHSPGVVLPKEFSLKRDKEETLGYFTFTWISNTPEQSTRETFS